MINTTDFIWSCIAFLSGLIVCAVGRAAVRENTMVEFSLAHYNEKTKDFVADSLEYKNDTIIIRKKN